MENRTSSSTPSARTQRKFLTVPEVADAMRVDPVTIYRAIRADAFPAVRIRGRYVVPSQILDAIADEALTSGLCVDVADYVLTRRPPERTR